MTTSPNELLWNHAIDNENFELAAEIEAQNTRATEGLGQQGTALCSANNRDPITGRIRIPSQPSDS